MADSSIQITQGNGTNVDTRTNDAGDHRQVVVLGNPTATDSVASVQATDPSSSALGVVVRDPLGTLTYNLMDGSGIRVRSIGDGTVSVENITRVRNIVDGTLSLVTRVDRVHNLVDGTISTLGALGSITNTVAVYFDRANPSVTAYGSQANVPLRTNSDGAVKVYDIVTGTINAVTGITNALPSGTNDLGNIIRVKNIVDGTLSTVASVTIVPTVTRVDRVHNLVDGTISSGTLDYVTRVRNVVDGTLTTVTGVDRVRNVVDGTLSLVAMTQRVNNVVDGTLATVVRVTNLIDGTVRVGNITGSTLQVNVGTIAGTTAVYLHSTSGTVFVKLARESAGVATDDAVFTAATGTGVPIMGFFDDATTDSVDENDVGVVRMTGNRLLMIHSTGKTAAIFTVSGSTSGGTTSGVTLVAPSASYNFKVFAYSLQTTAIASSVWRFTNGAGSETELFRGLVTAVETTSTPKGANMAVAPPSYLFATGVSTTLALKSDTGSLVHYSVSYIKESA